ncbi:MAG TPA: site-specific integrase [Microthrixaceae bacterium]|jgi:integrase|nr:site-specific integrase [Microthrixaceae bacterium]
MGGYVTRKGKKYYAVVEVERDPLTGKRRRTWHPAGATKRGAQQLLGQLLDDLETNSYLEPEAITVAEYLTDEWLVAARNELRFATYDSYRRNIENHVVPHIGAAKLQVLRPIDLTRYYSMLLENGRRDGRGGLSVKSVRNIHQTLRKAFDDAVSLRYLRTNPAVGAKPPRVSTAANSLRYWTAAELRAFLRENHDHRHVSMWTLAASTGMRRGELLGLRWRDIDLKAQRLSVRQTIISVGYEVMRSDPKTARGTRTIDLDARTVQMLRAHRADQRLEQQLLGSPKHAEELVFCRETGEPYHPDLVRQSFERRVRTSAVPRIRFHDLRHTHATLMLQAGVPPKVVSERLGHATVAFTMDVYAHVIPGMQARAAETFGQLVFGDGDES